MTATKDGKLRLLLVDDCVTERDLYEMVLEQEFRVLTAARGDAGVRIAAAEHPDVVLLDVMMPGMNGWETCTRLKNNPETAAIPVILLTGSDDADLQPHAKAVGAIAALTKPCPPGRLLETIHGAIEQRSAKAVWTNKH